MSDTFSSENVDGIINYLQDYWSQLENSSLLEMHHAARHYSFTYFMTGLLYNRLFPVDENDSTLGRSYWWDKSELLLHAGVYQTQPDDIWEQAWADTELAVLRLNQSVTEAGGKLVIMIIPNTLAPYKRMFPELYADEVAAKVPADIDFDYPARRLTEFADSNNIAVLDLSDNFERYAELHELNPPYFYYHCDGHWSPLGHYLAAHSFMDWLAKNDFVSDAELHNPELYSEGVFLQPSPKELLGPEVAKTVFGWRNTYRGDSHIGNE